MKSRFAALFILCLSAAVFSGCNEFNKTVNGLGSDMISCAENTSDGGYIMAGMTYPVPMGNIQAWLVKVDSKGNKVWDKSFGGASTDIAYSVQQTKDGGYIVAGQTLSKGAGGADAWLIKTDSSGNVEWDKTYGGAENDMAYSVKQTTDDGYIVAAVTLSKGDTNGDFWLIKTDSDGDIVWDKTFGGPDIEYAYSAIQTSDGGYLVTGDTHSFGAGGEDVWLIKTDASGNHVWDKTYGGAEFDSPSSVIQTKDGSYIITGLTFSFGAGGEDAWLIKVDADGNMIWNRTYGSENDDTISSARETSDGGFILAGMYNSASSANPDMWLIKTDSLGNMEWEKTFGGSKMDFGCAALLTTDDGYLLAGTTISYGEGWGDAWLIKTDKNGKAPASPK